MSRFGRIQQAYTRYTDATLLVDGLPPMLRRPDFWARILSEFMDLMAYAAIYVTTEVQTWPFVVAFGLSLIRLVTRIRFKTLWMVAGFLLQIFIGIELVLRLQTHPLVAAAHVAPIAMAWIGLARGSEDLWGWRMGLGFIGLILASALSPEFSVMLLILTFIVAGSTGLACRFLTEEFVRRGTVGSLPPGFIRTSFYQSGILLFSALLIFPLIPRMQGRSGDIFGNETPKAGYSEDVNLNEWTRVSGEGSSTPALRIYGPNGTDPNLLIPAGLLRSRILNILDANRWNPAPTRLEPNRIEGRKSAGTLMIVREMIGPANIPVPYGTTDVSVEMEGYKWSAEHTKISEWREPRSRNQRYNYYVNVADEDTPRAPQDEPTAVDLAVPSNFRSHRMMDLVGLIFKGKHTPDAKISAVQSYFQREKFQAVYAENDTGPRGSIEDQKLPPIERFLFSEKSGHCELFASSMAILLRLGGVPTRLVAGFRVSRNAYGDVLTVRQSDAHAWVEAYLPKHGWTALDPTPKVLHFSTVTDWVRDTYDWASAKWTQYILNFGEGQNSLAYQWEKIKKLGRQVADGKNPFKTADTDTNVYLFGAIFIVGAAIFSFVAVFFFRVLRRPKRGFALDRARRSLVAERAKMDRLAARIGAAPKDKPAIKASVREWYALYERARFGSSGALDKGTVAEIRRIRTAIEKEFRNSA
jgi:hypothetical protein